MHIRNAKNDDCFKIYDLHVNSIKHYCSEFYSENAITAWLELKSPEEYKNHSSNRIIIVAEKDNEIVGFGLINLNKKSIDSLYLKPHMSGKGIGKLLLQKLEEIAQQNQIEMLNLASTLNAVEFYHQMGYQGEVKSIFKLSSGINLDCVEMTKKLMIAPIESEHT
ncbi:GNAT family N-acetyltransferase [Legionella fairfieldensis]|uniref:GNAT family N-acetyltransferase n=1 Tax=Legionella fairfieldensis TaxID=45064 RepID=UPI00048EE742|nr:GNAT family N-acetyltransferase [Legionella fairfieldensis]